jgi:integrase
VLRLRVKDFDFERNTIFTFRSKGQKDRVTMFPELAKSEITKEIQKVESVHQKDIDERYGLSSLPPALIRKYWKAATSLSWQNIFHSTTQCVHP